MLEAAKLQIVGKPNALEQAYIDGWNDALEAVINNFGVSRETDYPQGTFDVMGRYEND